MYVGWGPPHLSLVVCYLLHLRIPISCKTWYFKECIKKYKNLVLDVIRTLDTSNQTTYHNLQNICLLFTLTIMSPKQMFHTTVMLGPLKFSLRAIIDHHGPPIHSGHSTASINCCKICNDSNITEFEIIHSKNSSTAYVILYELIDLCVLDSNRRVGVWSLPWRWHILATLLRADRGISADTCGLDDAFPPDALFPSRNSVLTYIYPDACILHTSSALERIYTCARSVVQYWWSRIPSQSIGLFGGSAQFLYWMPLFVFFGLPITSCSMINSLILEWLWPLSFVLNNIWTQGI